ncbi:hypothetical protein F5887DRAFT_1237285 [Amanita rubescens]|nr:hypothetical protein F5887DRAFT_1237285 [Amanita rubescens]
MPQGTSSDEPYEDQGRRTPPPAYTPYDPRSSVPAGYEPRHNPRSSRNRRSPYHSPPSGAGGNRRHRTTPDTHTYSTRSSPPGDPHPFPSAYQSSVGAPPPGVKPIGHVVTHETNGSIKGAYIIDPDKTNESTGKVHFTTSNGAIDVDLAVLPASLSARTGQLSRKTADLALETSCGGIKLRMVRIVLFTSSFRRKLTENRAHIQRTTTVYVKSSNGNVIIFLPRSFQGILKTTAANGKVKFSEGIIDNMTSINTWGAGKIAFIGSTEGLPPIPPEAPAEEDDYYDDGGVNISFRGNGVRNPGSGFFNGARNFSIVGGTFSTFPADAQVFHSWSSGGPTTSSSSRGRGSGSGRRQRPSTTNFELQWDGSRVDASSSNGNVQIAYDDEDAFGSSGRWRSDLASSSDSRRAGSGGIRSNFVITGDSSWPSWTGIIGAVF